MSDGELVPVAYSSGQIRRVMAAQLATALSVDQVRAVHDEVAAVVAAAEQAVSRIRALCGPSAAGMGANLATVMQMGTGYFREARDTIEAAMMAANSHKP